MSEPSTNPRIELQRPLLFALLEDERDLPLVGMAAAIGKVTALSVRSSAAPEATLLGALALGASRAVQVHDEIFGGVDYLAIAHTLACAIRHLAGSSAAPIVVLTGDRGRGAVGPAVAERLALPHLGAVCAVDLQRDHLLVDRQLGPSLQRLRGTPPIVLACILSEAEAKAASPLSDGASTTIEVLGLDPLHITQQELTYRRRFRPEAGVAPLAKPRVMQSVERLGDRLERDGVWPHKRSGA